jgi:hypothetical protein
MPFGPAPSAPNPIILPEIITDKVIADLRRALTRAQRECEKASERRRLLGTDCSRSALIAANAKWATAAESRDRHQNRLHAAVELQAKQRAATELFAALEMAVDLYGKDGGPWNVSTAPGEWLCIARAAIAKATGGTL